MNLEVRSQNTSVPAKEVYQQLFLGILSDSLVPDFWPLLLFETAVVNRYLDPE